MSEPAWRIADRYRVLGRIGAGGMADVLRAHDELLSRDVAIKVFRSLPTTPDTATGVERQQAELTALAQLNHPNLTMLYDGSIVGQEGPAYLVMELIDGPSLAQAIEGGGLTEAQSRVVGAQIGDALAYVHAAGMVHRDVKPANILLGSDRRNATEGVRARLTDFGIVRLVGNEPLTQVDMTLGSASYLAPEQARGSAVGPPADVYALGLTLIEALTGRRSFDGPALEAVVARLTNDPEIPTNLPEPWPTLLRAMTARDPAARPTAHRVAQVLRGSESVTAPITSVPAGLNDTAMLPQAAPAAAAAAGYPPRRPTGATPRQPSGALQPAEPAESRRRVPVALIVAGVLVLALLITGLVLLLSGGSDNPATPTPSTSSGPADTARASAPDTAPNNPPSNAPTPDPAPSTEQLPTTEQAPTTESAPSTRQIPSTQAPPSAPASSSASATTSTPGSASSTATGAKTSSAAGNDVTASSLPAPTDTPAGG